MKNKLLLSLLSVFAAFFFFACDNASNPCQDGTSLDGNGQCVANATMSCPGGTSWNGEACVGEPQGGVCPEGTSWSEEAQACVGAGTPVCPEGTTWNGEACVGASPPGPSSNSRKLSVQGGKIMRNGQPIVLRGMSLYWYNGNWNGGQPGNSFYTKNTIDALANPDTWNANLVRAAIGHVNPTHNYPANSISALEVAKNMIDWAYEAGIYVIIDNHSHNAHEAAPWTASVDFFKAVSEYVVSRRNQGLDYNHVIYEIYNEPLNTPWATIKTYAENVISWIRYKDPDGIILVGTRSWSARIDEAQADPITNVSNIMYALHYYASTGAHGAYITRYLKNAYCADFPVFISEWGTGTADGKGTINRDANNELMSVIEGAGVSWANWSLSNAQETSAALEAGVNGQTTESGTIVKNWIKNFNAGNYAGTGVTPSISCN